MSLTRMDARFSSLLKKHPQHRFTPMPEKTSSKPKSVALIPDRLASYRYTVFKRLSDFDANGYHLIIYADTREDLKGLKLVDQAYCDRDYANGGISWVRIRNFAIGRVCFWQSGLVRLAFSNEHQVHVYWGEVYRISTWLSTMISRMRGKKVVYWTHGIYGNEGAVKLLIRRTFYRMADAMLLYGDYGKSVLMQHGFDEKHLFVIKNSLDCKRQNELFDKHADRTGEAKMELFSETDRVLIFVGRLEPQKRLAMLLEALLYLNQQGGAGYKLLLVGDGSDRKNLVACAAKLGISQDVVFFGACYDDEVLAPLIMMADVCVSPGEVGLTAMHSLIFGTPVVTHNNFAEQMPEFEAITPGESGAFYEFNNDDDLCAKIAEVIGLIDDQTITPDSCRQSVLRSYTEDYQASVFQAMLDAV